MARPKQPYGLIRYESFRNPGPAWLAEEGSERCAHHAEGLADGLRKAMELLGPLVRGQVTDGRASADEQGPA